MSQTKMNLTLDIADDGLSASINITSDKPIMPEELADILSQYAEKLLEFADSPEAPKSA